MGYEVGERDICGLLILSARVGLWVVIGVFLYSGMCVYVVLGEMESARFSRVKM